MSHQLLCRVGIVIGASAALACAAIGIEQLSHATVSPGHAAGEVTSGPPAVTSAVAPAAADRSADFFVGTGDQSAGYFVR